MKFFSFFFGLVLLALNVNGATEFHHCVARDSGEACKYEIAVVCPSGFADGCDSGQTKTHKCVPSKGSIECAKEVAIVCPSGFADGCDSGNSNFHQCVAKKGTKPCAQEVALVCPSGFVDSCLQTSGASPANPATGDGAK